MCDAVIDEASAKALLHRLAMRLEIDAFGDAFKPQLDDVIAQALTAACVHLDGIV
jgi:hypothetical protein